MRRRGAAYAILALVCAAPRLAVLLHERSAITSAFTEKSDNFALTFVQHGTFGYVPGEPSAYTQPLYGWFLIPVYWLFGRSWESIGAAQLVLAIVTSLLVYEIGRRLVRPRWALAGAAIATLNPYLVWHDMHVNREICDQVCSAALVLLTLIVAERRSLRLAALLGIVGGLTMLGNTRMVFLPILCAAYLAFRLPRPRVAAAATALVLAGAGVAVLPWLVRTKLDVGCFTLTTDGRAMWKANNPQTYGLLTSGRWIDDVRNPTRPAPPNRWTPEEAYVAWTRDHALGRRLYPNECVAMTFYENRTFAWWTAHPGAKLKLMALSAKVLWQPTVLETTGRSGKGTGLDAARGLAEPAYMIALYVLAFAGLAVAPRAFVALALLLLAYNTACALAFVGATRYRIAWDFLLALLAATALQRASDHLRSR